MTSLQQRAALQRQIWQIANDVRGAVDGWDFKQYVLGTLFYRFISENFASYIEADDKTIDYARLSDHIITPDTKDDAIKTKGYFIYPSQLFVTVADSAHTAPSLNTDLAAIFTAIEDSASSYPTAEYALEDKSRPMGIAEYKLLESLPVPLQTQLPSIEEIERELMGFDGDTP